MLAPPAFADPSAPAFLPKLARSTRRLFVSCPGGLSRAAATDARLEQHDKRRDEDHNNPQHRAVERAGQPVGHGGSCCNRARNSLVLIVKSQ